MPGLAGKARAGSPPRVALTFDDGYNFDHRILDFLNSQGIAATAFLVGSWAQRNPSLLREMDSLGWDICNHTQNHPWLTKITDAQIVAELNTCQAVIGSITGQYRPVFRPPGGFIDARVMNVAASVGLAPVMWDFDSGDALNTGMPVQDRVNRMVSGAGDGDIILFHFGGRNTIDLVAGTVKGLQQRGFCFVTLSELYGWKDLVRGGDCSPGTVETATRYLFAEGTTRPGFEEWLLVFNPGEEMVRLQARFLSARGEERRDFTLPPLTRISVSVNAEVSWQDDVSTILESSSPVVAERMLYFSRGGWSNGGSLCAGSSEASTVHYFAEGSVRSGFEEYLAILNPSHAETARVDLGLYGEGGKAGEKELAVPPLGRVTVRVNDMAAEGDYSLVLRSSSSVAAERSEYFTYNGLLPGAHCAAGATAPQGEWYFAEGSTRSLFYSYLALFNPCNYATWVEVEIVRSDGEIQEETIALGAGERKSLCLNGLLPPDIDYSLHIRSLLPVVAERASYFQFRNSPGGYCTRGSPSPGRRWIFAEGCTAQGYHEWLALFNPLEEEQVVDVDCYLGGGGTARRSYLLQPESRISVDMAAEVGCAQEVSMVVSAPLGVVAERSVYFTRTAR